MSMLSRDLDMPVWGSEKGSGLEMWVWESCIYRERIWHKGSSCKSGVKVVEKYLKAEPWELESWLVGKSKGFSK